MMTLFLNAKTELIQFTITKNLIRSILDPVVDKTNLNLFMELTCLAVTENKPFPSEEMLPKALRSNLLELLDKIKIVSQRGHREGLCDFMSFLKVIDDDVDQKEGYDVFLKENQIVICYCVKLMNHYMEAQNQIIEKFHQSKLMRAL